VKAACDEDGGEDGDHLFQILKFAITCLIESPEVCLS